jgi:adenylate cyclase
MDHDPYTAGRLLEDLETCGFAQAIRVTDVSELALAIAASPPSLVVFNFHFNLHKSLEGCLAIRAIAPGSAVLALAAAGPAIKHVRQWHQQTGCLGAILEKPFTHERLDSELRALLQRQKAARAMEVKTARLENLLPEYALWAAASDRSEDVELFEATVVFTDIRRSSEVITQMPPREFFNLLNHTLSIQTRLIRNHEGSVVKFTGDGVLAVFRGMGRSYLALRCAVELASSSSQQIFPYGIGVACGLVLAGLVGDSQHSGQKRQYDVIGATVHLAARLCNMAEARQVVSTRKAYMAARLVNASASPIGVVSIRGFDAGVDCVTLNPPPETPSTAIGA